ncbi:CocE/NonD family hydrolase [Phytohabitans flavus]|uniref:Peptidase S15 n=1 Tax=Phytohabitans flavus TaxID=1076124 RepID=A0A6F8XWY1_9ACTN|nr:CocE/NonD family hydrolase [Phytohabitans flavus]BCB78346.1 peptidase S15 [Phytohabitans flavus]
METARTSRPETFRTEIADGMRIEWDVPIVMDDGIVLRADVFRPIDNAPVPVILTYGPYAKGLPFQVGYPSAWEAMCRDHPDAVTNSTNKYQNWEVVDPEKWVPHGYACVRVDSRGTGRSPGYIDLFSARETRDYYDCIEWAGAQPWSNGRVGLNGISYYAMNQWHVASLNPPHLAAICPWEGAADFYRDGARQGGIRSTFWDNWYDMQVKTVQYGIGETGGRNPNTGQLICGDEQLTAQELAANRSDFGADLRAHRFADEFHAIRSAQWDRITIPVLSCGNWGGQGLHLRGNVEAFVRAASTRKWLEMHGHAHWPLFYTDYGVDLQMRFFDRYLKGANNGWEDRPAVQLQIRHVDATFEPRGEDAWPPPATEWTRRYLSSSLALSESVPVTGSVSYPALGDGVEFTTPPLDADVEVTGPLAAKLFVSSSTTDADLFLVVRVYSPSGSEIVFQGALDPHTPVAQGWLRASHRRLDPALSQPYRPYHPHDTTEPLEPGEVYELDIEILPTCLVIPAGYRIALQVRGSDYVYPGPSARLSNLKNDLTGCGPFLHNDDVDRPAGVFDGVTTVHIGEQYPSHLVLPVIPDARRGLRMA